MKSVIIDPTFEETLEDPQGGSFYISEIPEDPNANADHYIVECKESKLEIFRDNEIKEKTNEVKFDKLGETHYKLQIKESVYKLWNKRMMLSPKELKQSFKVTSISLVSHDLIIFGTNTGDIGIFNLTTKDTPQLVRAHYNDVTKLKMLPSGKVLMSIGLDMQIKLWSINEETIGEPIRSFRGPILRINTVAIIGKGRNFVSGGDDGSVLVYECGSGEVIHKYNRINNLHDAVNSIVIRDEQSGEDEEYANQYECQGKVMYVGYELGVIQGYDLGKRYQISSDKFITSSGVVDIILSDGYLVGGYKDGFIRIWDLQKHHLVKEIKIDETIAKMYQISSWKFIISTGPDKVFAIKFDEDFNHDYETMIGMDILSKLQDISHHRQDIFLVSDGDLYKYR